MNGILELLPGVTQKIDPRPNSQSLADISPHWLLDRTVVLNPVHPRSIPDRGEIHRGISDDQVSVVVQLRSEHEVADPRQSVRAAEALRCWKQVAGRLEFRKTGVQVVLECGAQQMLVRM